MGKTDGQEARQDPATGEFVVKSSAGATLAVAWGGAIIWLAMSTPLAFKLVSEFQKGNRGAMVGMVFPAIGVLILVVAVRQTIQHRRYGRTELRLDAYPVARGGVLEGRVVLPSVCDFPEGVDVVLGCTKTVTTGTGKNRRTERKLLWQEKRRIARADVSVAKGRSAIPVEITIPWDVPDSDPDSLIQWRLKAEADIPGVDFQTDFEVTVKATEASDRSLTEDRIAKEGTPEELLHEAYAHSKIKVQARGETGLQILVPPVASRSPGAFFAIGIAGIVFGGVCPVLIKLGAPVLFAAVFGLVGLGALAAAVSLATTRLRTRFTAAGMEVRRSGVFGTRTTQIPLAKIETFSMKQGAYSSSGNQQSASYTVSVRHYPLQAGGDRSTTVASYIGDKNEARFLVQTLEKHLASLTGE